MEDHNGEGRYLLLSIESIDPPPVPASIGLGFVVASVAIVRSRSLKPLSDAIKLADSAISGTTALQVLHSPSPRSLLLASKALVKGYKATKRFVPAGFRPKVPSAIEARLKACLGAVSLLKHTSSPLLTDGSSGIGVLKGGYNISKNCAKVLEGVVGLQLNSALREGIDALGLIVRATTVGKEIKRWLLIERSKRRRMERLFLRGNLWPGARLSYKRSNFEVFHLIEGDFDAVRLPAIEGALINEMALHKSLSELLCLSIPVCIREYCISLKLYKSQREEWHQH
ncbi:hypothetical protein ZIOFF_058357 [Zingiber officinale]|uniref:Uncharacterized protein n=1 Tax=Zingiber officinale TaxID=94328 RepID=A0A8J5F571_ZINOF|nr:hypothetical protein ZIOFF_058357 [Zingiber officinale]